MARPTRLCHVCGRTFAGPTERTAHFDAEHAGYRVAWRGTNGREAWIVAPDGTETQITKSRLKAMRAAANRPEPPSPPPEPTDDDPAPEPVARIREPARTPRPPRVAQAPVAMVPTRTSLTDAFPQQALADIIRQISVSISEMDGAGPAGYLSAIESAQIASLLYDSTLDAILRYFGGKVDRFKVAMAVLIILLAKGRVHAEAITRKSRERRASIAEAEAAAYTEWAAQDAAPDLPEYVPAPAPPSNGSHPAEPTDPIAALAARQREARSRMS